MNSIEEYQNLVELLKQALRFYANKSTYGNFMGSPSSIDLDEHGSQARFALEQVDKIEKANQKMQDEYNKVINETIDAIENHPFDISDGETNPIDLINYFNSTHDE